MRIVGDHQLIKKISEGSYGEVWLARSELGTYRAVKIIQQARFDSVRPFQREYDGIKEFEPVSRVHDGLVDILHLGRGPDAESFYYVMELADDLVSGPKIEPQTYRPRTLGNELGLKGPLSTEQCIDIGIRLCKTLAFLHDRGLIHRDIKPSNIIFVDEQPKLADIGLVTRVDDAKTFVGTTGFIPPEGPNSPQADIYSLGKLLYELSTGKDRQEFPELPDRPEFSEVFLELNEVLVKACHADIRHRYRSAEAMAADLEVISTGRSVRRLHYLENQIEGIRKYGAALAAVTAILVMIYLQVSQSWQRAREQKAVVIGTKIAQGTDLLQRGDYLGALPFFIEALQLDEGNAIAARADRLRIGSILNASPRIEWTTSMSGGYISSCAIHGDDALINVNRGFCQVFNLKSKQAVTPEIGKSWAPEAALFAPDGNSIITANWDESVHVTDWRTGQILQTLRHTTNVFCASMSPDGRWMISGCQDGTVTLWDYKSKKAKKLGKHSGPVRTAKFNRNGDYAVSASGDDNPKRGTAIVWDIQSCVEVQRFEDDSWLYAAEFSPDGKFIATAGYNGEVRIWNLETNQEEAPPLRHNGAVHSLQFSPAGNLILTASFDGIARIWSRRNHELISENHSLRHTTKLMDACFGGTTERVLTVGYDGTVTLWRYPEPSANVQYIGDIVVPVKSASLKSPDGKWELKLNSAEMILERNSQTTPIRLNLKPAPSLQFGFDPKSRYFFAVNRTNVHLIDLNRREEHKLLHPNPITFAGFSPDGTQLVCASMDDTNLDERTARLWRLGAGEPTYKDLPHRDGVIFATFSPDSSQVLTTSEDFTAVLWDVKTGRLLKTLEHREKVRYAAFAETQPWIATVCDDGTAVVWDQRTGMPLTTPLKNSSQPVHVEFTDRDSALVIVDHDGKQWKWPLLVETSSVSELINKAAPLSGLRPRKE